MEDKMNFPIIRNQHKEIVNAITVFDDGKGKHQSVETRLLLIGGTSESYYNCSFESYGETEEESLSNLKSCLEEVVNRLKDKTLHQVTKMTSEQAKKLFKDCKVDFVIEKLYQYFTEPYTKG